MPAYPNTPAVNNPEVLELQAYQPRVRKNVEMWVTRGLVKIKPWQRDLRLRLARTWGRNRWKQQDHPHSDERWERERRLEANLKGGMLATRLPRELQPRVGKVLHSISRLINGGDWWQPRRVVDQRTGEVIETTYLPEDTWSAEAAFNWCVLMLARLVAAAWGVTEKVTPRSSPFSPAHTSRQEKTAQKGEDLAAILARMRDKYGGEQPELPSTT